MMSDCPDRGRCSRLGGICQCAEEESRKAREAVAHGEAHHTWPPGIAPAYERLREGAVARTIEVSDSVMVDVDSDGLVLGVETLDGSDWRDALVVLARSGGLHAVPRKGGA